MYRAASDHYTSQNGKEITSIFYVI